jgi:hypothetical protein
MAPTRDVHERLRLAKQDARKQIADGRQALRRAEAAERKQAKADREARRMKWGRILDQLGLLDHDDATVQQVLTVAYRLIQDGRVHWPTPAPSCDALPQTDAAVQAEVDRLIAEGVTLVLVREDAEGQPGRSVDGTAHAPQAAHGVSPVG